MSGSDALITSTRNPAIVRAAKLHRRRHRGLLGMTLAEGPSVVAEAIRGGARIEAMFGLDDEVSHALAGKAGLPLTLVTRRVLGRLAGTETPRGPVAVIDIPASEVASDGRLLVAWGVADPGNCGTLLRTAAAFGYGFVCGAESADPWSPKVIRSAAGAHFHTSVGVVGSVGELGERCLVGTVPRGGEPMGALQGAEALIVGSESHGLPEEVLAACDHLVSIPMSGSVESLNAAVAGGIAAYLGAVEDLGRLDCAEPEGTAQGDSGL